MYNKIESDEELIKGVSETAKAKSTAGKTRQSEKDKVRENRLIDKEVSASTISGKRAGVYPDLAPKIKRKGKNEV